MKVKVLQAFQDKHTRKVYSVDDVIEVTKDRLKEIQSVNKDLVKEVKTTKKSDK